MAHLFLSSTLPEIPSPAIARSCSISSSTVVNDGGSGIISVEQDAMEKLGRDFQALLESSLELNYSDAVLNVDGILVPVHRCILAARSSFFRVVFSSSDGEAGSALEEERLNASSKYEYDVNQFLSSGKIGYKSLMIVLRYLYGGKFKGVDEACSASCMEPSCSHTCCWPVIDSCLELLCASFSFDILDLKTFAERRLLDMVGKIQTEDVLQVVVAAWKNKATELQELCIQVLASSDIEVVTLEKRLPKEINQEIAALRVKPDQLETPYDNSLHDKQFRRVYKALDSDDVELVQLLLKESRLTIDSTFALHYAAAYCDKKTMAELLDLGVADLNWRDRRGYTVLHIATMRRDPEIIGLLLEKGANPLDLSPDGQTALQIIKKITKSCDSNGLAETREDLLRDKICVEILEQADKINPLSVFPVVGERELFMRLLYLENRVALARLLFPREAKVVLGLSQIDGTREFTGFRSGTKRKAIVDLNEEPFISDSELANVPPCMDQTLIQRVEALQRAVEVGQRFFPRCVAILNKFMDDGSFEHACIQDQRLPEFHPKKRLDMKGHPGFQDMFAEAFREDIASMDQQKSVFLGLEKKRPGKKCFHSRLGGSQDVQAFEHSLIIT